MCVCEEPTISGDYVIQLANVRERTIVGWAKWTAILRVAVHIGNSEGGSRKTVAADAPAVPVQPHAKFVV